MLDLSQWRRRLRQFFILKYPEVGWAGILGLIFVLIGSRVGSTAWQSFFVGTGSSLIAASIFSFVNYVRQEDYQRFSTLGIRRVYAFRNEVPDPEWCKWLGSIKKHCVLLGIAHKKWCEDRNFMEAVRTVVQRHIEIRVFFLDPTKQMAALRSTEEKRAKARDTVHEIRSSIQFMWNLKLQLGGGEQVFFRLFVYEGTPVGTNWFDDFMVVTHYLPGSANLTSPALHIESTGRQEDLYGIYKENAEKVEEYCSTEINSENVNNYI